MIVKSTFDSAIEGYIALKSKAKVKDAPLASVLLATKENQNNGLLEEGIKYQGCFFWFASIPMLVECLNHHADKMKLSGRFSASELKAFLAIFKDEGEKSLCAKYRQLYAIKQSFRDQVTKKGDLVMTAEEWCNKWFRGQQRGIGSSLMLDLERRQLSWHEISKWTRQVYNTGGGITLRALNEARDNPDFHLVNAWTKNLPCLWLEKLVSQDHFLAKNLGKWVRFINPKETRWHQFYPFRLVYLQYGYDGAVIYHGENQLTLPEGIRIRPDKVTVITEKHAEVQYLNSLKVHPYSDTTWGDVTYTSLWNPKKVDFSSEFHPTLTEATWGDFSKCDDYQMVDGKRTYGEVPNEYNKPLSDGAEEMFSAHMNYLRTLKVEEYVFHKKYVEISSEQTSALELRRRKDKIWRPRNIRNEAVTVGEIEKLEPEIVPVNSNDHALAEDWRILRLYSHSMDYDPTPARMIRFLVVDKVSGKYLGVTSIGSDVLGLAPRDAYIGSIRDRANHSCIGSCIMATQPFGYNFLGGKLVASILTTKSVRDLWEKKYGDVLVGFTTTSLYGTNSMYNSIPWWHKCGSSEGKITLNPDDEYLAPWRERLKKELGADYRNMFVKADGSPVTSAKQKLIKLILNKLKLNPSNYEHGYERGVYFASVYENRKAFFAGEIDESKLVMNPKFSTDVTGILDWWKPKAIAHYQKKLKEGRIKDGSLFYYGIKKTPTTSVSYEQARANYFSEVGR